MLRALVLVIVEQLGMRDMFYACDDDDDVKAQSGDWFSQTVELCTCWMAIDINYLKG